MPSAGSRVSTASSARALRDTRSPRWPASVGVLGGFLDHFGEVIRPRMPVGEHLGERASVMAARAASRGLGDHLGQVVGPLGFLGELPRPERVLDRFVRGVLGGLGGHLGQFLGGGRVSGDLQGLLEASASASAAVSWARVSATNAVAARSSAASGSDAATADGLVGERVRLRGQLR